jgi:hypothetical protein
MKIFVSWSGEYSRQLAATLKDWIPCVIQSCEVFVSAHDIGAGERWQNKINAALGEIDFGIVILTQATKDRPWINFEAGALAKHLDKSRVVPILCDLQLIDISASPLSQFQCISLGKSGLNNVMTSIFESLGDDDPITESVFARSFETWWPELENSIAEIESLNKSDVGQPTSTEVDRLGNIERAISDVISLIQKKDPPSKQISINTERPTAQDFFALPDPEFYEARITARVISSKAKTKEEIERAIKYIKKVKAINLQREYIPKLEHRLSQINDSQ